MSNARQMTPMHVLKARLACPAGVLIIYDIALIVHILAAIALVGMMIFYVFILTPALARVPPAHAAVIGDKVGSMLAVLGPVTLAALGVSGFFRLAESNLLRGFLGPTFFSSWYGWAVAVMFFAWLVLVLTGTLSGVWYIRVLRRKLPYSAGLRDLEARRARQERISTWQSRLNYLNVSLSLLAALGGALFELKG